MVTRKPAYLQRGCAEITEALVRSGAIDIVVVDSVAALVPREIDGEMGDTFVGLQARMMNQAMRKLAGVVNRLTPWWCSSTSCAKVGVSTATRNHARRTRA